MNRIWREILMNGKIVLSLCLYVLLVVVLSEYLVKNSMKLVIEIPILVIGIFVIYKFLNKR